MFARFLGNSFKSPSTVKNYMSGARTWIINHKGSIQPFMSPQVADVIKGVEKLSSHVATQAFPLSPAHIQIICTFIDLSPSIPLGVKPAILLSYASFLRASNVLSPTMSGWGGPHTLKACDVRSSKNGLYIIVRSSKTIKSKPVILEVFHSPSLFMCPVKAWYTYKSALCPLNSGPAFMLSPNTPLTPRHVVRVMRLALKWAGVPNSSSVSMHSLRRGAGQAAQASGAGQHDLLAQGTWRSKSVLNSYLRPQTIVPRLMASILAP